MPCHSLETVTLDLAKADLDLLHKALSLLGLSPVRRGQAISFTVGYYANGKLTLRTTNPALGGMIKRGYSNEVVKAGAARYGFKAVETAPNTYQLRRG